VTIDLTSAAARLRALGTTGTHPAAGVVAVRADGVQAVSVDGWAVLPEEGRAGVRMTPESLVDLASVTKVASTTALAMLLVHRGVLDLDAPVASVLPAFRGAGREEVLVRQLLAHTSGLPAWTPLYFVAGDREGALVAAQSQELSARPGTRFVYSDVGMVVLGAVLERVTGARQDEAFRAHVAEPLGLSRTGYRPGPGAEVAASSAGDLVEHAMVRTGEPYPVPFDADDFAGWRDGPTVGEVADGNAAHALAGVAGHAGLFAPAAELLRLGRALVSGVLVPREVLDRFTAPLDVAPDRGLGFRLGTWRLAGQAVPVVWHAGFTGTWLATALDRDLTVFAAASRLHGVTGTRRHPGAPRSSWVTTDQIAASVRDSVAHALVDAQALPRHHDADATTGGPR
jgi:serine-type D-Ala-D-Ala carboxypeptidase